MAALEQDLLKAAGGDRLIAARIMVDALMTDDPDTLQAGYSLDNAIIGASEYMNIDAAALRAEVERRMGTP